MQTHEDSFPVKIVALGFYDGATEGFTATLGAHGPCYFKMLAWDEHQDQRLFIAVSIERSSYELFLNMLPKEDDLESRVPVWIPRWVFDNASEQEAADKFVESCRAQAESGGVLVIGRGIDDPCATEFEVATHLRSAIREAVQSNITGNLAEWRKSLR